MQPYLGGINQSPTYQGDDGVGGQHMGANKDARAVKAHWRMLEFLIRAMRCQKTLLGMKDIWKHNKALGTTSNMILG